MTSAAVTRKVAPPPPASTKLQKMLALEHKLKIERLQSPPEPRTPAPAPPAKAPVAAKAPPAVKAPPAPKATSAEKAPPAAKTVPGAKAPPVRAINSPPNRDSLQDRRKDSISQKETFTMIMSTLNRDGPSLSITVPPLNPAGPRPSTSRASTFEIPRVTHPQKTVTFATDGSPENDDKSDASSICHSPSWEGYGQRKKDKKAGEKQRRMDKEQAEKDAREAKRKSASRLTKKPPSASRTNMMRTGRSSTTPEPAESTNSRRSSFNIDPNQNRKRSSSVTSQIRAALTGVLGGKEDKEPKDATETGFVGGLKLDKEREMAARETAKSKARIMSRESQEAAQRPRHPLEVQKANSVVLPVGPADPSPPSLPRFNSDGAVPNASLARQKAPLPISMRASSRSETLISPTAPPIPGRGAIEKWRSQTSKAVNGAGEEALPPGEHDAEEATRGRRGGSYVQQHRKLSLDRAVSGYNDENKVSTKSRYPPQANRQHHGLGYSANTDTSSPTHSSFRLQNNASVDSRSSSSDRGRFLESLGNFGQPYNAPSLELSTPQDATIKQPHERSRSRDQSRGFKGAMQAAFQKVRSSSRPPASSSSFFDRRSRDSSEGPRSAATSRPPSSSGHVAGTPMVSVGPVEKEPVMRLEHSARPSSSSSSNFVDSLRSPSFVNTPDSSRPQSDRGLPPVVGEVGKGKVETLLVANDERVFRLSHQATVAESTPAVRSPATPNSTFVFDRPTSRSSFMRDTRNPPLQDVVQVRTPTEHDADSFKSCVTAEDPKDMSSLIPLPLKITPPSSPKDDAHMRDGVTARRDGSAKTTDEVDLLPRAPSLSKSKSSPNVAVDTSQTPLVPPLRSPARAKHHVYQSSISLPEPLHSPTMRQTVASESPDPASYLQEARKAAPGTAYRHPRAPRLVGGRKEDGIEPVAKMFVECCNCKFFHDMPSRVYECMAHPEARVEDSRLGVSGAISTVVNCPWCKHGMSTQCCAGYAAVVYLKERLH